MKIGASWYVVPQKWAELLSEYTAYDMEDGGFDVGGEDDLPPPLDVSALVDRAEAHQVEGVLSLSEGTFVGGFKPLRADLVEGNDYVFLPRAVWRLATQWYGVAPGSDQAIERVVVNTAVASIPNLCVEAHPVRFTVEGGGRVARLAASQYVSPEQMRLALCSLFGLDTRARAVELRLVDRGGVRPCTLVGQDGSSQFHTMSEVMQMDTQLALADASPSPASTPPAAAAPGSSGFGSDGVSDLYTPPPAVGRMPPATGPAPPGSTMRQFFKRARNENSEAARGDRKRHMGEGAGGGLSSSSNSGGRPLGDPYKKTYTNKYRGGNSYGHGGGSSYGYGSGSSSSFGEYSSARTKAAECKSRGLNGIRNIGNTCFMNSALQCLSAATELTDFFLSRRFEADLNRDNPIGMHGRVAEEFAGVVRRLWLGSGTVVPHEFKKVLAQFAPQFQGYRQHDSHELVAFLLDGLHEDLNRVLNKPAVPAVEDGGRPDAAVAAEAWEAHLRRNRSVIVDIFQGQFRSRITCPGACGRTSVTFDPLMYLSLPLAKPPRRAGVLFLPRGDRKPVVVEVDPYANDGNKTASEHVRQALLAAGALRPDEACVVVRMCRPVRRRFASSSSSSSSSGVRPASRNWQLGRCMKLRSLVADKDDTLESVAVALPMRTGLAPGAESAPFWAAVEEQGAAAEAVVERVVPGCRRRSAAFLRPRSRHALYEQLHQLDRRLDLRDGSCCQRPENGAFAVCDGARHEEGGGRGAAAVEVVGRAVRRMYSSHGADQLVLPCLFEPSGFGSSSSSSSSSIGGGGNSSAEGDWNLAAEPFVAVLRADAGGGRGCVFRALAERADFSSAEYEAVRAVVVPFGKSGADGVFDESKCALDAGSDAASEWRAVSRAHTTFSYVRLELRRWSHGSSSLSSSSHLRNRLGPLLPGAVRKALWTNADVLPRSASVSLFDCVRAFVKPTRLSKADAWYCSKCAEHVCATKKMDVYRLPSVLIIHLKRFRQRGTYREKVSTRVDFPLSGADFSDLESHTPEGAPDAVYDCFAVSNHHGTIGGGHYTAYAKRGNQWHHFDDSSVRRADERDVCSEAAYMLFYRRRAAPQ